MISLFWFRLHSYCRYRLKAKGRYRIHSPFLFNLLTNCFYKNEDFSCCDDIEIFRRKLLRNKSSIEVTDLGAGATLQLNKKREIANIAKYSLGKKKYLRLLFKIIKYFKCDTILELGTSLGVSTAYLARASSSGVVYTIEGCPNIAKLAQQTFQSLQIQNIELCNMPFDEGLQRVFGNTKHFDLIFIDGNHRYDATLRYFEQCLQHVNNESIVVLDDIHWSREMETAWLQIQHHPKVTLTLDVFQYGIVFFRKQLSRQQFVIKY